MGTDNLVEIDGSNISERLDVIDMFGYDLTCNVINRKEDNQQRTSTLALMQSDTRVGNFVSWKFVTVRLSAADLRLRGAGAFLNGSAPDALAQE
jgi:hypothetical protein